MTKWVQRHVQRSAGEFQRPRPDRCETRAGVQLNVGAARGGCGGGGEKKGGYRECCRWRRTVRSPGRRARRSPTAGAVPRSERASRSGPAPPSHRLPGGHRHRPPTRSAPWAPNPALRPIDSVIPTKVMVRDRGTSRTCQPVTHGGRAHAGQHGTATRGTSTPRRHSGCA